MKERAEIFKEAFSRVADADEWGVKIFGERQAPVQATRKASNGTDYLRKKSELLQPRSSGRLDRDVASFIAKLTKLAVAFSPGGKASAGQPGLIWHGSFLVRRKDRKKLETELKKDAAEWAKLRRIDCSGPWPPYSFVGEHVQ